MDKQFKKLYRRRQWHISCFRFWSRIAITFLGTKLGTYALTKAKKHGRIASAIFDELWKLLDKRRDKIFKNIKLKED